MNLVKCTVHMLVVTLVLLGSGNWAGAADKVIKVGTALPLTGGLASTGRDNRAGVELAVDIINNKHPDLNLPLANDEGIPSLGHMKIEVIYADSQADPNIARAEVGRLIENEGVVAILGGDTSAEIKTGSEAAERLKTPYVSGGGSSSELTQRGLKYFFRLCPTSRTNAESFFDYIADLNKMYAVNLKTVAILYENTEFGADVSKEIKSIGEGRGFKIVAQIAYPANTTSLLAEVMRLKAANPEIFAHVGYISDSILLAKTMQNQNFLPKVWYGSTGYDNPTFVPSVGKASEGAGLRAFFNPRLNKDVTKKVSKLYTQRYGREMSTDAVMMFIAPFVLADAINRAGSLDKEAIVKALEATNIPGGQTVMPWDSVRFSPFAPAPADGHNNITGRVLISQLQNGQQEIIWPFPVATAKPIFPLKPYDRR